MKTSPASSISKLIISTTVIISLTITSPCLSQNDTSYDDCSPLNCGNITFPFPFSSPLTSGRCGLPGYQITCKDPSSGPKLLLSDRFFQVRSFLPSDRIITVVDTDLIKELSFNSCKSMDNRKFDIAPLNFPEGSFNLTFYKCPSGVNLSKRLDKIVAVNIRCDDAGDQLYLYNRSLFDPPASFNPVLNSSGCGSVQVPVSNFSFVLTNGSMIVEDALGNGFPLTWPRLEECEVCQNRSGRCGYDGSSEKIICFCEGGCHTHKWDWKLLVIGLATGSCSLIVVLALLLLYRNKISLLFKKSYSDPKPEDGLNVEQFIKTYRSALLTNYSYNDVKKITNGFKEKLGAGGYGNVYKGKFLDGRLVAVKMLEKSNDYQSHNFINEVSTIGRIHHVNIINLVGFCCDGSTRALIYEYMAKGSIGDLLSTKEPNVLPGSVKLLEIALGVAHAIEYLHNGCELRILHLDIKPENVLLDQDLCPKISDFGLAKMHSRNRSVVTMTGARGTIGYIAPEIFLRHLGNPSRMFIVMECYY